MQSNKLSLFILTLVLANLFMTCMIAANLNNMHSEYTKNSKYFKDAVSGMVPER